MRNHFYSMRIKALAMGAGFAAMLLLGCSPDEHQPLSSEDLVANTPASTKLRIEERIPDANLILIVSDTMRRDRMGVYGGPAQTGAFDSFAKQNILFEHAYTQSPWTKPSMATTFTSIYPSQHKVLDHPQPIRGRSGTTKSRPILECDVLNQKFTTMAEVLRESGFRTAAFVGNPWMVKPLGFSQGFQVYDDSFADFDVAGNVISDAGLQWLQDVGTDERFFLYLHYMDCHRPYAPVSISRLAERATQSQPEGRTLSRRAAEEIGWEVRIEGGQSLRDTAIQPSTNLIEMAYDGGVERFDRALEVFLAGFADHPAYERTAILIISDHGEALYTRGYGNHGQGLYNDETQIPFAARLPGVLACGNRIQQPVGLVDLLPSCCTYLGIECPETVFGESWLTTNSEPEKMNRRPTIVEGVGGKPSHRAIVQGAYKLLWQPQAGPDGKITALFNLADDPHETHDLFEQENAKQVQRLVAGLLQAGRGTVPEFIAPDKEYVPIDPAVQRRLKSLGYLK